MLSRNCCNTAPTATSEASVAIHSGASGLGWDRSVVLAKISLILLNAVVASSDYASSFVITNARQQPIERVEDLSTKR